MVLLFAAVGQASELLVSILLVRCEPSLVVFLKGPL